MLERGSGSGVRAWIREAGWLPALSVLAGGALLLHVIIAATAVAGVREGGVRDDWTSLYAAGTMVRGGDASHLYDRQAQIALQDRLYHAGRTNMFPQLPFVAYALAPMTMLSFESSMWVMLAINVFVLAVLSSAAWRALRRWPRGRRMLFVGGCAVSAPVVSLLFLSQVDLLVLGALLGCYYLRSRERPLSAGAMLAFGLFKPHLLAAALLLLAWKREWRTLAGFAAVAAPLIVVPMAAIGWPATRDLALLLLSFPKGGAELGVSPERMINLRGTITGLTGSTNIWLWVVPQGAVASAAVWRAVRVWGRSAITSRLAWAIALTLPLIASPHVHMTNAVLLLAACGLYIDARISAGQRVPAEWLCGGFVVLTAMWMLSLASMSVMSLVVVAMFVAFACRWPKVAAVGDMAAVSDERLAA